MGVVNRVVVFAQNNINCINQRYVVAVIVS